MDCVNGPAVLLAGQVLKRVGGYRRVLEEPLAEGLGRPINVLRMVARSCMPGGLLLPWDNYGYQFGVRSTLVYGARRTGEEVFLRVLEEECIWTYDIGIGWAYDDFVWTLIWWPHNRPAGVSTSSSAWRDWYEPLAGAAFAAPDGHRYVIQMWDESTPVVPTRGACQPERGPFLQRLPHAHLGGRVSGRAHPAPLPVR